MTEPIQHQEGILYVDIWYPKTPAPKVEVDLVHVRAADPIRVSFDFPRNVWVIEQPYYRKDEHGEDTEDWREVTTINACTE